MMGLATGRMGVGLIGDRDLGRVLALGLAGAGHALIGRSVAPSEREESVQAMLPDVPVLTPEVVCSRSELVLLALDGEDLRDQVQSLTEAKAWVSGQLVCHLGMAHGLSVLDPAKGQGALPLRLLPLLPFTGTSVDLVRMREAWCVVSAPSPILPIAQALAIELGMEPLVADDAHADHLRAAYLAATDAARDVVTVAMTAFREAGLAGFEHALGHLLVASVEAAVDPRSES